MLLKENILILITTCKVCSSIFHPAVMIVLHILLQLHIIPGWGTGGSTSKWVIIETANSEDSGNLQYGKRVIFLSIQKLANLFLLWWIKVTMSFVYDNGHTGYVKKGGGEVIVHPFMRSPSPVYSLYFNDTLICRLYLPACTTSSLIVVSRNFIRSTKEWSKWNGFQH